VPHTRQVSIDRPAKKFWVLVLILLFSHCANRRAKNFRHHPRPCDHHAGFLFPTDGRGQPPRSAERNGSGKLGEGCRTFRRVKKLLLQKKQFFVYCVIGASGSALDLGVYSLLIKSRVLDYQAANAVGYACGTLLSFILNAKLNFRVTDKISLRLLSFFGVALLGWLASAGLLHLLIGRFGFDKYISKFAALVVVVLLQYSLNCRFSFRKAS
jgi:putative flippase GtrA